MEPYMQHLENAKKYAKTAEHLLTNTFPVVQDPRMLLTVLNNVFMAFRSAMLYMLDRDVSLGKLPPFEDDNFKNVLDLFKARSERRYSISPEYVRIANDLYATLGQHRASPIEFARHEMFIICSDNYEMKKITTQNLREYIGKAKLFIDEISTPAVKHERVS
jgi:hypothetical protein